MKSQTESKRRDEKGTSKSKPQGQTESGKTNLQQQADSRSRGDAPSATKRSERSPKTENL